MLVKEAVEKNVPDVSKLKEFLEDNLNNVNVSLEETSQIFCHRDVDKYTPITSSDILC